MEELIQQLLKRPADVETFDTSPDQFHPSDVGRMIFIRGRRQVIDRLTGPCTAILRPPTFKDWVRYYRRKWNR